MWTTPMVACLTGMSTFQVSTKHGVRSRRLQSSAWEVRKYRLITRAERDRRRREYHLAQRVAAKKTKQNATKARDAMRHSARGGVWTDSRTPTATGLHSSHMLRVCGGVVFCLHCGGTRTGAGGMRGLLPKPCPKRVAPGSVDRLSKLKQGWLCRGLTEWPDAAAQPADQRAVRPVLSKVVLLERSG